MLFISRLFKCSKPCPKAALERLFCHLSEQFVMDGMFLTWSQRSLRFGKPPALHVSVPKDRAKNVDVHKSLQ